MRIAILIAATTFFLLPPQAVQAQKDEKDAIIEQQKKLIELLEKQSKAQVERLAAEIDLLSKVVRVREALIANLETEVRKNRMLVQEQEAIAKARQVQNENLLEQVRALTKELARLKAGEKPPIDSEGPGSSNPPGVDLKGKIEKVEGDLVQINLGKDHGLAKNHTLEAYRLQPQPKYLGVIRIVEVNNQTSIGRLVPTVNAASRAKLIVGDLVASKLTREN